MNRSSHRIAVILPVEAEYPNRLLEGAIAYAEENPSLTLIEMLYTQGRVAASPLPDGPLEFDAAMVWLNAVDSWVQRLLDEGIFVMSCSGDWPGDGVPMVAFSGVEIENAALGHLAGPECRGTDRPECRQIAYIGMKSPSKILSARRERFLGAAARRGMDVASFEIRLPPNVVAINRIAKPTAASARALRSFLVGLRKPSAVWCDDDYVARLVCDHAAREGLRVPEDIAVLGLGDYSVSRHGNPPISTIPQPGQIVGRHAIELICGVLDGGELSGQVVAVPPPPVLCRESTGGGGLADERFQRIRREIHDRACEGLAVPELAEMLSMSQVTFSKHFARIFGRTPGEEIRRVRLERARHYLRSTTFPIERVAALCGFDAQGNFTKFFKRWAGTTPSEYRGAPKVER